MAAREASSISSNSIRDSREPCGACRNAAGGGCVDSIHDRLTGDLFPSTAPARRIAWMRSLAIAFAVVGCFAAAPVALAATQTAQGGNVTATFTFKGAYPKFKGQRLSIAQSGNVLYDQAVASKFCGTLFCGPLSTTSKEPSVHVIDLEHTGQPDVVLDLFSGGAHCCVIEQIFSFDAGSMTYIKTERNFGDPGERIEDLRHDGRFEFLTADDSFAYAFTDYAASGLPIQILTFSNRHFTNVTRSYPKLVARDAARWLRAYHRTSKQDSVGLIAAWAADEFLLGHRRLVSRYLEQEAKAGH